MKKAFVAAAIAAMVTLGACEDSTGPEAGGNIQGTYSLKTINGQALPFVIVDFPGFKAEILSGSLTFGANGVVTSTFTDRTTEQGVVTTDTETDSGTYTQSGATVTFIFDPEEDPISGTVSGNTLTVTTVEEGISLTFVFQK